MPKIVDFPYAWMTSAAASGLQARRASPHAGDRDSVGRNSEIIIQNIAL